MKIHVSELEGRALDYVVSVAIGRNMVPVYGPSDYGEWDEEDPIAYDPMPEYSKVWAHTGPLIDKYVRILYRGVDGMVSGISLCGKAKNISGPDHLVTACRIVVATELGELVSIPDELVK